MVFKLYLKTNKTKYKKMSSDEYNNGQYTINAVAAIARIENHPLYAHFKKAILYRRAVLGYSDGGDITYIASIPFTDEDLPECTFGKIIKLYTTPRNPDKCCVKYKLTSIATEDIKSRLPTHPYVTVTIMLKAPALIPYINAHTIKHGIASIMRDQNVIESYYVDLPHVRTQRNIREFEKDPLDNFKLISELVELYYTQFYEEVLVLQFLESYLPPALYAAVSDCIYGAAGARRSRRDRACAWNSSHAWKRQVIYMYKMEHGHICCHKRKTIMGYPTKSWERASEELRVNALLGCGYCDRSKFAYDVTRKYYKQHRVVVCNTHYNQIRDEYAPEVSVDDYMYVVDRIVSACSRCK